MATEHKPPFTGWVYERWKDLAFGRTSRRTLSWQRRVWLQLYDDTFRDGRWLVPPPDASLVSHKGALLAIQAGDYAFAREVLNQFLSHPDLRASEHLDDTSEHLVLEGVALTLSGDFEGGLDLLHERLKLFGDHRIFKLTLRNHLHHLIYELGVTERAPQKLAELTADLVSRFRGRKRVAARAQQAVHNRDLVRVLSETFRRR